MKEQKQNCKRELLKRNFSFLIKKTTNIIECGCDEETNPSGYYYWDDRNFHEQFF